MQRNNPSKKRRRPFQPGNPGRPRVAAQKSVEALLDIDGGRGGPRPQGNHHGEGRDMMALRLCSEVPPPRERALRFAISRAAALVALWVLPSSRPAS